MEFQLSYFKSWKMTLWMCCIQYASKFGKLSSGHRTGKRQVSFWSQRKAMPKNVLTTTQLYSSQFSSVQSLGHVRLCDTMNGSTPHLPVHHQLPEFTQILVHRVSDTIQPSHPLSSPSPDPIPPSIKVFSNESTLHMRWPKSWSFMVHVLLKPGFKNFKHY